MWAGRSGSRLCGPHAGPGRPGHVGQHFAPVHVLPRAVAPLVLSTALLRCAPPPQPALLVLLARSLQSTVARMLCLSLRSPNTAGPHLDELQVIGKHAYFM